MTLTTDLTTPMIRLTDQPIDTTAVLDSVRSPAAGAMVLFVGTVREMTGGRKISSLQCEYCRETAEKELAHLEAEARNRWPLVECSIVHRLGHLGVGEIIAAVAVNSAHRRPAFEAAAWLIDRIKEVIPVREKEIAEP